MFIGPVFTREVVTAPRRTKLYVSRATYAAALLILISTAWLLVTGTQVIRNLGDMALFGSLLFQFLAPLQLVLALAFSALLTTSAVAQEKDRRTLVLLLMTQLTNRELVLGKLMAGMLVVLVMLVTALPIFMLLSLFGGIAFEQIVRVFAVTLATALVAGSLGSTLAFWREKTFQTLALVVLSVVVWLVLGEIIHQGELGAAWQGIDCRTWATWISPWRAIAAATAPYQAEAVSRIGHPANGYLITAGLIVVLLNAVAIFRVRHWQIEAAVRQDPTGEAGAWDVPVPQVSPGLSAAAAITPAEEQHRRLADVAELIRGEPLTPRAKAHGLATVATGAPRKGRTRQVWDNPIVWREIMTWAYGRKVLVIRVVYLLLVALCVAALVHMGQRPDGLNAQRIASAIVPLFLLSLVLVNAQAVTSFCSERDTRALDLLLVTDLTPHELVFGKLGGVFYNAKEMVLMPLVVSIGLCLARDAAGRPQVGWEEITYLVGGLLVMNAFVAMLGIHAGMTYANSKSAIGVSLGTVFFLFLGVATCMRMMVAFAGSFEFQMLPFLAFLVGGGVGLLAALGVRNPSDAIGWTSLTCPFATFWAITSLLQGFTLSVFLVLTFTYGFATAALLIPALDRFDVALGRTTGDDQG